MKRNKSISAAGFAAALLAIPILASYSPAGARAAEAAPTAVAADAYTVDPGHSAIFFRVKHLNVSNAYGRFNKLAGTFTLDDKKPEASSVEISVESESVDTNNPGRDKHLRSTDFFSAKEFPKITFKSTAVKKAGEHDFEVTGDLTIRGVTKPVTLKATHTGSASDPKAGSIAGFEAVFTVKRSDFGVKYGAGAIGEEVQITVSVEGGKQSGTQR
jgi:polyisoprenoid-binding protein YceI